MRTLSNILALLLAAPGILLAAEDAVIQEGSKVSIEYTLALEDGTVASSNVGQQPLVYDQGAGQILPALEKELLGLKADDMRKVVLEPADGYGEVDPAAFQTVEPKMIPEDARRVGAILIASNPQGQQRRVRVHEVTEERVVIDYNHPLAGRSLHFEVRILSID